MTSSQKTIRSLLPLIFLNQTALTLTFPLITLIFFDTKTSLFAPETTTAARSVWYGLCVALPNFINLFFAPLLSMLSDILGRKKILVIELISAAFFAALTALGIYLGNIIFVFLGFIVKGAFSRSNPTALAIIGDSVPPAKKILYMGYLQFSISMGAAVGPIAGGYLATMGFNHFNFAVAFIVSTVIALLSTGLAQNTLTETFPRENRKDKTYFDWQGLKICCQQKTLLSIGLILILTQISWSAYYQFIPPILKTEQNFNATQLGWFIGMIACWLALASGPLLTLLHRFFNMQKILICSLYLLFIGLILTATALILPLPKVIVWAAAFPIAAGDVIAYSCIVALFSNLTPAHHQGKIMGIGFLIAGLTWSVTSFGGGFLMSHNLILPLILAPAGVLTAIILIHTQLGKKLAESEQFAANLASS